MVRGVTEDFWATFVDPDPDEARKARDDGVGAGRGEREHAPTRRRCSASCARARRRPTICTDPTQAGMFLSGVTMARAMTMGAPLFGSVGDFIAMMKGSGPMGGILKGMGMTPVKFLSESGVRKDDHHREQSVFDLCNRRHQRIQTRNATSHRGGGGLSQRAESDGRAERHAGRTRLAATGVTDDRGARGKRGDQHARNGRQRDFFPDRLTRNQGWLAISESTSARRA